MRPGWVRLRAEATDFGSSEWARVELAPDKEREGVVLTLRQAGRITGEIHRAVGKIEGLQVNAHGRGNGGWHNTETDSDGRFVFEGLTPGKYEVQFTADMSDMDDEDPNYWEIQQARSEEQEVTLAEGGEVHVVLGSPPDAPIVVTGRVTSGGEPVAGTLVEIRHNESRDEQAATTDSNGTYSATVDGAGEYTFSIGNGWGAKLYYSREIPVGDEFRCDIDLPTAKIVMTLLDERGEPLNQASVQLERVIQSDEEVQSHSHSREGNTDPDGTYTFEFLEPGTYIVRAGGVNRWGWGRNRKEYGREVLPEVVLKAGEARDIELKLERAGSVRGRVIGSLDGRASIPCADAGRSPFRALELPEHRRRRRLPPARAQAWNRRPRRELGRDGARGSRRHLRGRRVERGHHVQLSFTSPDATRTARGRCGREHRSRRPRA